MTALMHRYALLIDANYFFNAGAYALTGMHQPRRALGLANPAALVAALHQAAQALCDAPLPLRAYWFDSVTGTKPTPEQSALAYLPGVKLRLGAAGHVDEATAPAHLLGDTLVALAQARAVCDAVVLTGDEGLRTAMLQAQTLGLRVHLLALGDATKSVSPALRTEVDSLHTLDADWLRTHLRVTQAPAMAVNAGVASGASDGGETTPADDEASLHAAARSISLTLLDDAGDDPVLDLSEHVKTNRSIPPTFDGRLIARTSRAMNRTLTETEKRAVRGVFLDTLHSLDAVL